MAGKYRYYFPGGNTPEGFVSYYRDIMPQSEAARIFCIKGGPGTGKSTFMKQIGEHYIDEGMDVDLLKCSSDPASLDGIVIKDKNIAIIDGTAPHVTDPINPGAVDEIIDLGKHLDENVLIKSKDKIISLGREISETFEYAYVFLKCADIIYSHLNDIYRKYASEDSIYKMIMAMKMPDKRGRTGKRKRRFGSAITSAGIRNELSSLSAGISNIYLIEVPTGYRTKNISDHLSQRITDQGYDVEELYCPMNPYGTAEHIISPDADIAVFTCNEYHLMDIFDDDSKEVIKVESAPIDDIDKARIEELKDIGKKNIDKAIEILSNAKEKHDELEVYYIGAMDFNAMEDIKKEVIDKIEKPVV